MFLVVADDTRAFLISMILSCDWLFDNFTKSSSSGAGREIRPFLFGEKLQSFTNHKPFTKREKTKDSKFEYSHGG